MRSKFTTNELNEIGCVDAATNKVTRLEIALMALELADWRERSSTAPPPEDEWYCRGCLAGKDNRDCEDTCPCPCHGNAPPPEARGEGVNEAMGRAYDFIRMARALDPDCPEDEAALGIQISQAILAPPPEAPGEGCDCPQNHLVQCARYLPAAQRGGEGRDGA